MSNHVLYTLYRVCSRYRSQAGFLDSIIHIHFVSPTSTSNSVNHIEKNMMCDPSEVSESLATLSILINGIWNILMRTFRLFHGYFQINVLVRCQKGHWPVLICDRNIISYPFPPSKSSQSSFSFINPLVSLFSQLYPSFSLQPMTQNASGRLPAKRASRGSAPDVLQTWATESESAWTQRLRFTFPYTGWLSSFSS